MYSRDTQNWQSTSNIKHFKATTLTELHSTTSTKHAIKSGTYNVNKHGKTLSTKSHDSTVTNTENERKC